jgi:hypothetical protein
MNRSAPSFLKLAVLGGSVCVLALATAAAAPVDQDQDEPISVTGHGSLFDRDGAQIVPSAEFVARAQAWYRAKLLAGLDAKKRAEFAAFEKRLVVAIKAEGQARLVVEQRLLDWLVANSPRGAVDHRTRSKLNALEYQLSFKLPAGQDLKPGMDRELFRLEPRIRRLLDQPQFKIPEGGTFLSTTNAGQAYINECAAAQVPIPPPIGQLDPAGIAGWKTQGFIPEGQQFITQTPAEVRTFESPLGMCIALPRYTDASRTMVMLDGVVCLSKITSKVCFWDNQMNRKAFPFAAGDKIPIGVPDLTIDPAGRYQAGGFELEGGSGGVCTNCHAGENPYIVHPNANLSSSLLMGKLRDTLPMFAPNRYDPIVPASWPQNQLSQSPALVPPACRDCHKQGGTGGRLPHLSTELKAGYCDMILRKSIGEPPVPAPPAPATMPQFSPGTAKGTTPIKDLVDWCTKAATAGPANRGDPHLTTTNGIDYDFQAAGEFTSLRNSDTGFELQTRQTPVATSFVPDANHYTGLASCVSLNTAAAVRVGKHRITYQQVPGRPGTPGNMQLKIDGKPVEVSADSMNLGRGNTITKAAPDGGIDVKLTDGTRLIITPNYWASQDYWYLNVEVLNTPAREGTMGHIPAANWLPLAPNGFSFGPAPASLADRHVLLNEKFADAWRVTPATSLFDYEPGTSTANFTDYSWPPKPGDPCKATVGPWGNPGPIPRAPEPMRREEAQRLCSKLEDKAANGQCVFDLTVTGDPGMAAAYQRSLMLRAKAGP